MDIFALFDIFVSINKDAVGTPLMSYAYSIFAFVTTLYNCDNVKESLGINKGGIDGTVHNPSPFKYKVESDGNPFN